MSGVLAEAVPVPAAAPAPADAFTSTPAPPKYSPAFSVYIVFMFGMVAMLSTADRYILSILMEPIRKDLGASDTTMGLVSGLAFSVVFATAGIPLARLADTGNRRALLASAIAVWSGFTAACGASANVVHLFLARTGVAAAESAVQPAMMSMIGDMFSAARRGLVTALSFMGGAAGILVGSVVGDYVATHYGWQMAFVVMGIPGLLFALLFWLTIPEPIRGAQGGGARPDAGKDDGAIATLRYLLSVPSAWRLIFASVLLLITQGASGAWMPTFFLRVHEMSMAAMSAQFGLFMGLSAIASMVLSGFLSDRLAKHGESWRIRLIGCAVLLGAPFIFAALLVDNVWLAWGLIVCFQIITGGAPPMIAAAGLGIVRPRARATWVSLYNLAGFAIGGLCGPVLVGFMSDTVLSHHGDVALRYSLMIIPGLLVPAALVYFWASVTVDRDARRAAGDPD